MASSLPLQYFVSKLILYQVRSSKATGLATITLTPVSMSPENDYWRGAIKKWLKKAWFCIFYTNSPEEHIPSSVLCSFHCIGLSVWWPLQHHWQRKVCPSSHPVYLLSMEWWHWQCTFFMIIWFLPLLSENHRCVNFCFLADVMLVAIVLWPPCHNKSIIL